MYLRRILSALRPSLLRRALTAVQRGDPEAAARLYEDVLAAGVPAAPDVLAGACEAHLQSARRRSERGDLQGALQSLQRAAELQPEFADVQAQLGRCLERLDQFTAARAAYERAIEINPQFLEARLNLARVLAHLHDAAGARAQLEAAAAAVPHAAGGVRERIAAAADTAAPADLAAACAALLADSASEFAAELETIRAALRAGEDARAIAALKSMLGVHPDFADLHNLLGVAYDNADMPDDAIEEFEQALRLNPDFTGARVNLGVTLFARARYAEAEFHLRRVAETQPEHALARHLLAQIETHSDAS